ncbi:MAG: alpha-E domain-containing protein [Chitinophagaceae bacterium]
MLSRIADSLYWLNRYMERADGMLRTTLTHTILLLDKDVNSHLSWKPVLETFTYCNNNQIEELNNNSNQTIHYLLVEKTNTNSLTNIITRARENARGVQDHITKEVWEHVNAMYHTVNTEELGTKLSKFQVIETIEHLLDQSTLYTGVSDSTMPRGQGWDFMNLGKYLERCLITVELVDKFFEMIDYDLANEKDILYWRPMLLSLSGYELHLKTYRSNSFNKNALHQVLFNQYFTRSLLYSLTRLRKYFAEVVQLNKSEENEALVKCLGRIVSKVEFTDFETLHNKNLEKYLNEIRAELNDFSIRFSKSFFSYY